MEAQNHRPSITNWRPFRECIADREILDSICRHREHIRGAVLDLGCGDRRYEGVFAGQAQSWIGLNWPENGDPRARLADVYGDALAIPFRADTFDTVLCTQVIEHVPEPWQLLCEARRVLRPGGRLVLTAPQYNALHEEPRDFFRFTCYGLRYLAEKAGLRVQVVEPVGGFLSLFGFICVIHFAPLRFYPIYGVWQAIVRKLDRIFPRPKDCLGYVLVAQK